MSIFFFSVFNQMKQNISLVISDKYIYHQVTRLSLINTRNDNNNNNTTNNNNNYQYICFTTFDIYKKKIIGIIVQYHNLHHEKKNCPYYEYTK